MFSKNFKEADQDEIEIKGVDADDFELLLTHIYGGEVSLDEENVYRLLKLANYLCLQNLEDVCVKYLSNNVETISSSAAVDIFIFASRTGKTALFEKFAGCVAKNFENVSKGGGLFRVDATGLMKILRHPNLVRNSLLVLNFLEQWVQFQSEKDKELLPELLNAVNLQNIPKEWFVKILTLKNANPPSSNLPQVSKSKVEQSQENNTGNDETKVNNRGNFFIDTYEKKYDDVTATKPPFILYSLEAHERYPFLTHQYINLYKFKNSYEIWPMREVLPASGRKTNNSESKTLQFSKLVFVNELHYLITMEDSPAEPLDDKGRKKNSSTKHYGYKPYICRALKTIKELPVYEYNSKKRDLPNAPPLTACESNIYLYNDGELIMLDGETHQWTKIITHNFVRTEHPELISYKDNLYLIGGKLPSTEDSRTYVDIPRKDGKLFQRFDMRTDKWCQMPVLKHARSKSASCIHNDILYVSGGDDLAYFKGYIECFDFQAGRWYELETSMPKPKFNHILRAYDNRLWFFGGQKYEESGVVEDLSWFSYDLENKIWSDISYMPVNHCDTSGHKYTVKKILDVVVDI